MSVSPEADRYWDLAEGFDGLYEKEVLKFLSNNQAVLQQVIATAPIITGDPRRQLTITVPHFDPPSFKYDSPGPKFVMRAERSVTAEGEVVPALAPADKQILTAAEDRCPVTVAALRKLTCEALGLTVLAKSLHYQPQIETLRFETVDRSRLPGKVHWRQTIKANMLRNALVSKGPARYGDLKEEDIYRVLPIIGHARQAKAVVVALGIAPTKYDAFLPYVRRTAYCGILEILAGSYDGTEIVFITQEKQPQEVNEETFFCPGYDMPACSGTSYDFTSSILDKRYQGWDVYAFMFASDRMLNAEEVNQATPSFIRFVKRCKLVGLARVGEYTVDYSAVSEVWRRVTNRKVIISTVKKSEDIGIFLGRSFIAIGWQKAAKQ